MTLLALIILLFLAFATFANIFDYQVLDAEGNTVPLSIYKSAKAVLVVNVASGCSLTDKNFRGLREMYDNLHERGLEILAFPTSQFGKEPRTNAEIQEHCKENGVNFPVFAKINVNGPEADPLYKYLKRRSGSVEIRYNFVKILVVNGAPVKRFKFDVPIGDIALELQPYLDAGDQSAGEL